MECVIAYMYIYTQYTIYSASHIVYRGSAHPSDHALQCPGSCFRGNQSLYVGQGLSNGHAHQQHSKEHLQHAANVRGGRGSGTTGPHSDKLASLDQFLLNQVGPQPQRTSIATEYQQLYHA